MFWLCHQFVTVLPESIRVYVIARPKAAAIQFYHAALVAAPSLDPAINAG